VLTILENNIYDLDRIFGSLKDKTAGGWTKFLNEELHNLYSPRILE
jgi:hypothetical protein